jgi:hypothetical protein
MTIFDWIIWIQKGSTIALLVILLLRRYRGRSSVRERWAILTLFFIQFGSLVAYYIAWSNRLAADPLTQGLLWPKSNFLIPHVQTDIISLLVGWGASSAILLFLGWFFVRRGKGKMLDASDVAQLFIASVAVGWPTIFIVYGMIFVLAVVMMIGAVLLRKKSLNDRLIITPAILPATIITLLVQDRLLALTHLAKIGF